MCGCYLANNSKLILGLGSNLGCREIYLKRAITRLTCGDLCILRNPEISKVYESPALVPSGAPDHWNLPYLNCAISGDPLVGIDELLPAVKEIEESIGRSKGERWAPRVIDIDILWWPDMSVIKEDLQIPHRGILDRSFVVKPLRDLIPEDSLEGLSFRDHAMRLSETDESIARYAPESDYKVNFPELMGILNITPDSFSDGGLYLDPEEALGHARMLIKSGAGILDLGAESTRPDGQRTGHSVEWDRLEPVLQGLRDMQNDKSFRISLDSRNPETVRKALDIGIDLINDVTGFSDPKMLEIAQGTDVPLVFMHSLSVPVVKGESIPKSSDPIQFLQNWTCEKLEKFSQNGISRKRLIFDPGIGFGKTHEQNWQILGRSSELHRLDIPLLIGHSRKSFFELVTDKPSEERDPETLEVSDMLANNRVEILRVHDVEIHDSYFRNQFFEFSVNFLLNEDRR